MQTLEFIARIPVAERSLGAHRWGLHQSTPRVLAARVVQPAVALQICRRGADAGAPQLVQLLVEHGGAVVPRTYALELEAARLVSWFPIEEHADGWSIPRELAVAAAAYRERERFFSATLLTLLSPDDRAAVEQELELVQAPTRGSALRRLVAAVASIQPPPSLRPVAETTAEVGSLDTHEILRVAPVAGAAGTKYTVELKGGRVIEVCPREHAEALGVTFEPVLVTRVADIGFPVEIPAANVPPVQAIGAIVEFATPRAADEAMRVMEFKSLVVRRLDDRRVAMRPSCTVDDVADLLAAHGFMIDPGAK